MATLARSAIALTIGWLSGCSALGPDDREHRYELRLVADAPVTVDYELEVFADNDGKAVKVSALFRHEVGVYAETRSLNDIATSSPGYLGVKVLGASLARLRIAAGSGSVTAELLTDGTVSKRTAGQGAGALIQDVRVGKTF